MEPERSSPAEVGLARKAYLNSMFGSVVQHLLEKAPHANFFRRAVSSVVVDDYQSYVPADREVYLGKIVERTGADFYSDVEEFRADLQLMYENAATYNGPNGGRHAYEPVIHWAADILAAADNELQHRMQQEQHASAQQEQLAQRLATQEPPKQPDVAMLEAAADSAAPAAPASATVTAPPTITTATVDPPSHDINPLGTSLNLPLDATQPLLCQTTFHTDLQPLEPDLNQQLKASDLHALNQPEVLESIPHEEQPQPLSQQLQQRASAGGHGHGSPRAANGSAGQQSSCPSTGSGDGSHSGLEALLAACELAAEQDSTTPRAGAGTAPERRSYPGCDAQAVVKIQEEQGYGATSEMGREVVLVGPEPILAVKVQQQPEQCDDMVEVSLDAGGAIAMCSVRSGEGVGGEVVGADWSMVPAQTGASGGGCGGGGGVGGGSNAGGSYLASNAFKNRRHKSKVFIKPNKVVYLPTTFVEEEFDVTALPLDCELRVEADGMLMEESFRVTIKSVPRQGLSTMYCMTNVMRFQQQYLNWQIYNWTRINNNHIKIHLQSPSPSQTQLLLMQRPDLDRATSMPEVGRSLAAGRGSDDGGFGSHLWQAHQRPVHPVPHPLHAHLQARGGPGVTAPSSSSLKRKSDTGRYNVTRVERRLVPEPGREMHPMEPHLSSTGYVPYPSPIPESPPASPQRRISACPAATAAAALSAAAAAAVAATLPPRGPPGAHSVSVRSLPGPSQYPYSASGHPVAQPPHQPPSASQQLFHHQQQIQIHHHHHYQAAPNSGSSAAQNAPSGHYSAGPVHALFHWASSQHPQVVGPQSHNHYQQQQQPTSHGQMQSYSHSGPGGAGGSGNGSLSLSLALAAHQLQPHQQQVLQLQPGPRGSNSSMTTKQEQQTCSEDSSGPIGGSADAAATTQLAMPWHQNQVATAGGAGRQSAMIAGVGAANGGGRSGVGAAVACRPAVTAAAAACAVPEASTATLELTQQLRDLADHLVQQAKAAGGDLPPMAAVQLAMAALQQQQSLMAFGSLHRGSTGDGGGGGGAGSEDDIAPLDLANPVDQERLLQLRAMGSAVGGGAHAQGPRNGSGSGTGSFLQSSVAARRGSADGMAADMEFGRHRPPSISGAVESYMQQQEQQQQSSSSHLHHQQNIHTHVDDHLHQRRVSYTSDRGRLGAVPTANLARASLQFADMEAPMLQQQILSLQHGHGECDEQMEMAGGRVPDLMVLGSRVAGARTSDGTRRAVGDVAMDGEAADDHHIVCYPRRSGSGSGGNGSSMHFDGNSTATANAARLFPSGVGSPAPGPRFLLEVAPSCAMTAASIGAGGGGGRVSVSGGGRVSGSGGGRRACIGGSGVASVLSHMDLAQVGAGGLAGLGVGAFPPGALDLADCGNADIISILSPSKRFKVAVSENAPGACGGGVMNEISVSEMLSLRAAAAAAAAGTLSMPSDAGALAAALRHAGGGGGGAAAVAAMALGGRPFLPVGPEIMGQLI